MPQRRKTRVTPVGQKAGVTTLPGRGKAGANRFVGGALTGVLVTGPDGRQKIIPFEPSGTTFLRLDGTFASTTGGLWGSITGTLSDQVDLQAELDAKQDLLVFDADIGSYILDR